MKVTGGHKSVRQTGIMRIIISKITFMLNIKIKLKIDSWKQIVLD